jgi:Na+/phosphate symporter
MRPGDPLLSMFQDVLEMLALTWTSFGRHDAAALDKASALGRDIHGREKSLTEQLLASQPEREGICFVPSHLERASDPIMGLIRCLRDMEAEGTVFTDRGLREINQLFEKATDLLECARDLALTGNHVLARHVEIESMRFHDLASEFARAHEERLIEGVCMPKASSAYLAMVDYLREIARHARRIATRVVRPERALPPLRDATRTEVHRSGGDR